MSLTPKQLQIFQFIASRLNGGKVCPSIREVCEAVGIASTGSVHRMIGRIIERGYLMPAKHKARGFELVPPKNTVTLNSEICFLIDQYASAHQIPRDAAVERLIRNGASA